MVKCTVKSCGSRSEIDHKMNGVTFHTIPKESRRKEKWIDIIRLLRRETDWLPSKRTVICSKHFKDEDKIQPNNDKGYVRLSQNAIPILGDEPESTDLTKPGSLKVIEDCSDIDNDEEMQEIFEIPQIRKMDQTINRLKLVAKRRLECIQKLRKRNMRLVKKNKKLKDILKEMNKT